VARRRPTDPATEYARAVVRGKVVASRLVRQACQRHLTDLEQQGPNGLVWREDMAQEAIDFFAEVLILPERADADESAAAVQASEAPTAPMPFVLEPWQQFIVGSAFGWYTVSGFRRFREIYLETGKGSGKTPLAAGMLLYLLVADGVRGAQVFIAATVKEQARLAFVDAEQMVAASPALREILLSTANNLAFPEMGSFLRAISSEKRGLDGKRVHGALIDELHEQASHVVVNKMRAGIKGRRNAMIIKTTNAGFDRQSVCWHHHEYSRKVLDGTVRNETWFAFICGLDPCAACLTAGRWFPDEECPQCDSWEMEGPHWRKANPNLGVSLPWQYLRDRVSQAQGMPSEVSDVQRFNFCIWTQSFSRAIDMTRWGACAPLPTDAELVGAPCFGCLDLGETDDLSAWGRLWVLADGRVAIKMTFWLPDIAIERFPNRPYPEWRRRALVIFTEGEVTDYDAIRTRIKADYDQLGMQAVYYDTRSARETAQLLMAQGVEMVPITQGFGLHEAIKRLLELIKTGQLCHGADELLSWQASNTVLIEGARKEKRLAKERSPEKIDGIAALVMGIEGAIIRGERKPAPSYEMLFFGGPS